jgi:hypothetical protein
MLASQQARIPQTNTKIICSLLCVFTDAKLEPARVLIASLKGIRAWTLGFSHGATHKTVRRKQNKTKKKCFQLIRLMQHCLRECATLNPINIYNPSPQQDQTRERYGGHDWRIVGSPHSFNAVYTGL